MLDYSGIYNSLDDYLDDNIPTVLNRRYIYRKLENYRLINLCLIFRIFDVEVIIDSELSSFDHSHQIRYCFKYMCY